MIGQFPRFWIPPSWDSATGGITHQQRMFGRNECIANTDHWQGFLRDSGSLLMDHLQQASNRSADFIPDLHQLAGRCFGKWFPSHALNRQRTDDHVARALILTKWDHRRLFQNLQRFTRADILKAWFHITQFCKLKRAHSQHARQVRKDKFHAALAEAQIAANKHDMFHMFQIINKYAPKQQRRRMQLHNHEGALATPSEERALLTDFVRQVWQGPATFSTLLNVSPGVPFSFEDLRVALKSIPITKAVARTCAPGIVWNQHADVLAGPIYELLLDWWSGLEPYIPDWWRAGWLLLIPKPCKAPTTPFALRPLALQDHIGKCLVGILAQKGLHQSLHQLVIWPLWAYLPARSTQDPLLRVTGHCRCVRNLVKAQRPNIIARSLGMIPHKLCGGVQVFIDLQRAFDSIDRVRLFSRLPTLDVDPRIVHLLSHWHQKTVYFVQHSGCDIPVEVGKGVRQGCRAAPWLFNCFLLFYLQELSSQVPMEWIQSNVNLFADDSTFGGIFTSLPELLQILHYIDVALRLLQSWGLQVNDKKSAALLALVGSSSRRVRSDLVLRNGMQEWLKIGAGGTDPFLIPIVRKTKYLGAIMSYHTPEDDTLTHRISLARTAFSRLQKWLTRQKGLATQQRLQLWTTCVYSVLSYSICTIGITISGLQKFTKCMFSMIRQVLGDHAFYTGHSHAFVFHKYCIDLPLVWLWKSADNLHRSVTERLNNAPSCDIIHQQNWSHLPDLMHFLQSCMEPGDIATGPASQRSVPTFDTIQCQLCDFQTQDPTDFRRHCTLVHGKRMFRTRVVDIKTHMLHGLPQCKFCFQTFVNWRNFAAHVQRGCQVLQVGPPACVQRPVQVPLHSTALDPLSDFMQHRSDEAVRGAVLLRDSDLINLRTQEWGPRLLEIVGRQEWHRLKSEQVICNYLTQRCCLCNQFVGANQSMHQHLKQDHADYWPMVLAKGVQFVNLLATDSPCEYCNGYFVHTHTCNCLLQIAMLLIYGAGLHESEGDRLRALRCEICGVLHADATSLHQHLLQEHRLVSTSWNIARDSVAGDPACAHCGALYDSLETLRSHINQGRCPRFQPDAACETVEVLDLWCTACTSGQLLEVLRPAHHRLRLTLHCQHCACRYTRAADLAAHLQGAHAKLWNDAQTLTAVLIDLYYQSHGCCCNPGISQHRANHVCLPLRQLAMIQMRLQGTMFFQFLSPTRHWLPCFSDSLIEMDDLFWKRH